MVNELVKKISSYNIFNYLFPGTTFAYLVDQFTEHKLIQEDLVVALFLYYFIGLVISRIGSLIIEPILKWSGFAPHSKYEDYVAASKQDEVIAVLSEQNNMYRTIIAMTIAIGAVVCYDVIISVCPEIAKYEAYLLLISLGLLFLFSYRKQTAYITKRVKSGVKGND